MKEEMSQVRQEIVAGAIILGYNPNICKKCHYLTNTNNTPQNDGVANVIGECSWDMHKGKKKKHPVLCLDFCYLTAENKNLTLERTISATPALS